VTDDDEPSLRDRLVHPETTAGVYARDVLLAVGIVAAIGGVLFALGGVWPPAVAVESGSMAPHLQAGDMVFVSEPGRYAPPNPDRDADVVPSDVGQRIDYRSLGDYGSVIVFSPPGRAGSPLIHRARFWVAAGENWYDRADPTYLGADNCRQLRYCPAPHAGFVTKGDANARYDQAAGLSPPVRPAWVRGVAHVRTPYLGYLKTALPLWAGG
jgi:signal peptidase